MALDNSLGLLKNLEKEGSLISINLATNFMKIADTD
jgi:hypothetical protein